MATTHPRDACPFCAGRSTDILVRSKDGTRYAFVNCRTCNARGPSALITDDRDEDDARSMAVREWNGRNGSAT